MRDQAVSLNKLVRPRAFRRLILAAAVFTLSLAGLPAFASAAECTDTWTGPAEGSWGTASSWSAGHAPGESDVACIGSGKTVEMTAAGTNPVQGVQGAGKLFLRESTLNVLGTGQTWQLGSLTMSYQGVLTGPATLEVTSALHWESEATMSGSGQTVLGSSSLSTIGNANSAFKVIGRRVVNEGTVSQVSYGYLALSGGGVFENLGTYNLNAEKSLWQMTSEGAGATFVNNGTFRKAEGTGEAALATNFESLGLVQVSTGRIRFEGAGHSVVLGDASSLEGPVLCEQAGITAGSITAPKADLTLRECQLSVPAGKTASLGTLTLNYKGNVGGAGTLGISNSLVWQSESTMLEAGTTVIEPSATATVTTYWAGLNQRTLVNEGTFNLEGEGAVRETEGAVFRNEATINANCVESYARSPGILTESSKVAPILINNGLIEKSVGTGNTRLNINVENSGTIRAKTGTLLYNQNGATASLKPGSILEGVNRFEETAISGKNFSLPTGTLSVRESPVAFEGTSTKLAKLKVDYGTVVSGSGEVEVTEAFLWEGQSTLGGSGKIVLGPKTNNVLNSGASTATLSGGTLVNEGSFNQVSYSRLNLNGGAAFKNRGTYNLNAEPYPTWVPQMIENEGGGSGRFVNSGQVQRTEGSLNVKVVPPFENQGALNPKSSKIEIEHPEALSDSEKKGCSKAGDPVSCASGNFSESQTDVAVGGRGIGLNLTRTYSAQAAVAATSAGSYGYGWSASFGDRLSVEEGGAKVALARGDGSTVPFTRVAGTTYSGPVWSQETLSGSPEAGYTFTTLDQTRYRFSGAGRLESITDRNGNETTLSYDESGHLKAVTDPTGRQLTFAYNTGGQVESVTDPMGHVVKYAYEGGNLTSVTMPGAASPRWQFKYDASHRITQVMDGRGGKTTNEFDGSNRVISQTDPAGRTLTFKYEAFHTKITNKATGAVTDEWFTSDNEPYSITHGYGTASAITETFAYNEAGQMIRRTDGNGHTTSYGYDEAGNRTSEKDPLGHETKWTYNGTHDVTSMTTPRGETTTIKRDSHGNVESIARPAPGKATQTTGFAHDEHGQLESITDPLERTWTYGYDAYGDRTSETDPLGETRTLAYDEDSRLLAIVSPRGNLEGAEPAEYETTVEHDAQGRPLKITDPLGHATEYAYDGNGNLASLTDAKGHTTKYTYNGDDEQTKVEKPNGATLENGYDGAGFVTSQTDGNGKTTTFVRNVLEQPVEVVDPLGRKTLEAFDSAGNLAALVDPAERETTYSYDAANRLTGVAYSEEATPDVGLEYDADGNPVAMSDGTGESTFAYDQLGRLTRSEDGHGDVVEYSYDLGEQQTGIVYPNGKAISRAYDGAGRLESITDWLGGTTTFGYDADSNLTGLSFPAESGNSDEYSYDRSSRMSEVKFKRGSETLASLTYTRDPLGQVEEEARTGLPGPEAVSYGYDKNNRLTEAGAAGFEYDAADQLTKGIGSTNTYDAAGQLETGTGITYSYDKLGERTKATPTSGPTTSYGYDQAGNLVSINRPEEGGVAAIAESLAYNGTGLLASKTSGLATEYLTWDSSTQLPRLLDDEQNSYVYGPYGLPIEQISSAEEPTYLHHDQLGSTRMLTDTGGETSATFSYAPYGELESKTGIATTPLGFAGQYTDTEADLQYLQARFYDPRTGQFLAQDPLSSLTRTPYGYAEENPLFYVDPSGLSCTQPIVVGGFTVGEIPDLPCMLHKGAEEIAESPYTPPAVGVLCGLNPECGLLEGLIATGGLETLRNLLKSGHEPCYDFWSNEVKSGLALFAAKSPDGLLEGFAGSTPPAVKILTAIPGTVLDAVRAIAEDKK